MVVFVADDRCGLVRSVECEVSLERVEPERAPVVVTRRGRDENGLPVECVLVICVLVCVVGYDRRVYV